MVEGFTKKYNVDRLVHYEVYSDISDAIEREKEIKGWSRAKKNALINNGNPKWEDLFKERSLASLGMTTSELDENSGLSRSYLKEKNPELATRLEMSSVEGVGHRGGYQPSSAILKELIAQGHLNKSDKTWNLPPEVGEFTRKTAKKCLRLD
jgi:hypothetical protein